MMVSRVTLLLLTLLAARASAVATNVINYPVKSVNLASSPSVAFWALEQTTMEDAHPVEGIQTSDRGFVVTGRALEGPGQPDEGFAIKFSSTGVRDWEWRSNHPGYDYTVSTAQLPNGEVLIAGYRAESGSTSAQSTNGVPRASLTKLNVATGQEVWTALFYQGQTVTDDEGNTWSCGSIFASVSVDADGSVALGGARCMRFSSPLGADTLAFHSAGNPSPDDDASIALVIKLPYVAVSGTSAPTSASIAWTYEPSGRNVYARTVHFIPGSGDVAAVVTACEQCRPEVPMVRLSGGSGTPMWGPLGMNSSIGILAPNDFDVTADGSAFVLTGNHPWDATTAPTGIGGFIAKVSASDGAVLWSTYQGVGVMPRDAGVDRQFLYDECWSAAATADGGALISCGVGIEGCFPKMNLSTTQMAHCMAGVGDSRAGAIAKPPAVWSVLTVRVDGDGEVLWQRTDARNGPDCSNSSCHDPNISVAGEWAIRCADGTFAVVVDDVLGVGLVRFGVDDSAGYDGGNGKYGMA